MRRTKIVCTIGPASGSLETLQKLIAAGLDVARLNFSHGTHEQHALAITAIREAEAAAGRPIAILQDLQGPRIRIGNLPAPISVESGQTITLATATEAGGGAIPVTYSHLPADVKPGDRILI
ncbi:MAG: pyruvate kinase, partial [Nitrospirae bacterium]